MSTAAHEKPLQPRWCRSRPVRDTRPGARRTSRAASGLYVRRVCSSTARGMRRQAKGPKCRQSARCRAWSQRDKTASTADATSSAISPSRASAAGPVPAQQAQDPPGDDQSGRRASGRQQQTSDSSCQIVRTRSANGEPDRNSRDRPTLRASKRLATFATASSYTSATIRSRDSSIRCGELADDVFANMTDIYAVPRAVVGATRPFLSAAMRLGLPRPRRRASPYPAAGR